MRFPTCPSLQAFTALLLVAMCLTVHGQAPLPGIIKTVAGTGAASTSGDGGPAIQAGVFANQIAADFSGNVYLSNVNEFSGSASPGDELRRIDAVTGIISSVAGDGTIGGPQSFIPRDLAVDSSGNVFALALDPSDSGCYIAKVTPSTGQVSTFQDEACPGRTIGNHGNATNRYNSVAVDAAGNVYWAELIPLSMDPYGRGELQYTTLIYKKSQSSGTVVFVAGNPNSILVSGDGGPASQAGLGLVGNIRIDSSGSLYMVSPGPTIRKIDATSGVISTIAGGGFDASLMYQGSPTGFDTGSIEAIAVDPFNHLFIADTEPASQGTTGSAIHLIRLLDLNSNTISTIAGGASNATYGDNGPAIAALLGTTGGLTTDNSGNLYLSDYDNSRLRVIGKPSATPPPVGPPQQPQVYSVSPTEGGPGGMVTITGLHFGVTQGSSTVDYEGQPAPLITNVNWSDSKITFIIPQSQVNYAISGLISVVNSVGPSNATAFTILPSGPAVTSMLPDPGSVGTQVTIYGGNFGSTAGQSTVMFGSIPAAPISWSPTAIVVTVPSGAATGNVIVIVSGNASNGFLYLISGACSPVS